jgi:uncharacterized protein YfaS (alpha-2-macroglobulin family)
MLLPRDGWGSTQENVFCLKALRDYAKTFEKSDGLGRYQVVFDGAELGSGSFRSVRDEAESFRRPLTSADQGSPRTLEVKNSGTGSLYYTARLELVPETNSSEGVNNGFQLVRRYSVQRDGSWEELKDGAELHLGELVAVDLFISLPAQRAHIAISDPVPGFMEPVRRELKTSSAQDSDEAVVKWVLPEDLKKGGSWEEMTQSAQGYFYEELKNEAAQFFAELLPEGRYHQRYVAQVVANGSFTAPPAKISEMYHPETFGRTGSAHFVVK